LIPTTIVFALTLQTVFSGNLNSKSEHLQQSSITQTQVRTDFKARRHNAFTKTRELLSREQVPFDPDVLTEQDWRERMQPVFDQMPELKEVKQGGRRLK